jgi:uncharacterized protein CbrC (UPF0167 family)
MQTTQDGDSPFKYFLRPHHFSTYSTTPETCYFCGRLAAGYKGPFYGAQEIKFVCEPCLVQGRLAEVGAFTNGGNITAVMQQLARQHPELSDLERETIAQTRNDELSHATPSPETWQDFDWPAHCGDYCCYLKEAGKPDLIAISPNGNVRTLIVYQPDLMEVVEGEALLWREYIPEEHFDDWWEWVRPDSPKDSTIAYSMGVYLFQCLHCQKYIILWDQD